jgi:hypothetical protein
MVVEALDSMLFGPQSQKRRLRPFKLLLRGAGFSCVSLDRLSGQKGCIGLSEAVTLQAVRLLEGVESRLYFG